MPYIVGKHNKGYRIVWANALSVNTKLRECQDTYPDVTWCIATDLDGNRQYASFIESHAIGSNIPSILVGQIVRTKVYFIAVNGTVERVTLKGTNLDGRGFRHTCSPKQALVYLHRQYPYLSGKIREMLLSFAEQSVIPQVDESGQVEFISTDLHFALAI